ncbi:glycosyltransferase family A protein [Bacteroidota bacterium]
MSYKYSFTVFTPVYNRKDKIHRVWESLLSQSFKDFEWILVDDGSSDNIIELLMKYREEASFTIKILQQENQGKHFAWNKALRIAEGELFVPADSDDRFSADSLLFFNQMWNSISIDDRNNFAGVNVLCLDPISKNIIGNKYSYDGLISDNLELAYHYKIKGEKWGCIRTDLLKEIPFPQVRGRGCYNPSYIWYNLAKNYKTICFNRGLRYYYSEPDSITKKYARDSRKTAYSNYHFLQWHINSNYLILLKYNPFSIFKIIFKIIKNSKLHAINFTTLINEQKYMFVKILIMILYFPSVVILTIKGDFKPYIQ